MPDAGLTDVDVRKRSPDRARPRASLHAARAVGDGVAKKCVAAFVEQQKTRRVVVRRHDERQAAVARLRDRVTHECRQGSRVHLTLLPRRLEAERMGEPARGERGVYELPNDPGECGHLVTWSFRHWIWSLTRRPDAEMQTFKTENISAPAAARSPGPISGPPRPPSPRMSPDRR